MTAYACRPWTHPDNYAGEIWPNHHSAGFGQSRDSDALERSNFRVAVKALGDHAEIVREGHWAVGWIEWLAIPSDDTEGLEIARGLCARANCYPVLDEGDHSQEEQEEADQVWRDCYTPAQRVEYMRANPNQFDGFRSVADMLGCARGKYFAGYASELIY